MMQAKTGDGMAALGDNQRRGSAADRGQSGCTGATARGEEEAADGAAQGELGRRLGSAHGIGLTLFSPRYLRLVSFLHGVTKRFSLLLN